MDDLSLSQAIEDLMVSRNLRGMKQVQGALQPGYFLRAATHLKMSAGTILIGTGFPVADTFETDGPVGAMALYQSLETMGATPVIVCGKPLSDHLQPAYRVHEIRVGCHTDREAETRAALSQLQPDVVISIERPGLSAQGGYFNMRGEDISERCACFDYFVKLAPCPTIAIGDGGNEIGMGNIRAAIEELDIVPAVTGCDELLIADVSNWAAYGLLAIIGYWRNEDLLGKIAPLEFLHYLSQRGSVDGVTRENTLTEDGLPASEGLRLIEDLRRLTGFGE
jgi:D-glutamate cyclase-like, C-terminal